MRFFIFMRFILTGEAFETEKAGTIRGLLDELNMEPERVAVEVNLSIVRKSDYSTFTLHDGDSIEIVNFVGGG